MRQQTESPRETFHVANSDAKLTTCILANLSGGGMACKSCSSDKQQYFSGELSVTFLPIEKLKQAPVYVVQKILVCLDCGYTELIVPTAELDQLRQGM